MKARLPKKNPIKKEIRKLVVAEAGLNKPYLDKGLELAVSESNKARVRKPKVHTPYSSSWYDRTETSKQVLPLSLNNRN